MDYSLQSLRNIAREIGRGVVFRAPVWDGQSDLSMTHLGDTTGEIVFNGADSVVSLRNPELAGKLPIKSKVIGAEATATIPLVLATNALRKEISPTNSLQIGKEHAIDVVRYTLVVFPYALFRDTDGTFKTVSYTTGGGWLLNGQPLTAEGVRHVGNSLWMWDGYWSRPPLTYRAIVPDQDIPQDVEEATFQAQLPTHDYVPAAVTIGDPADHAIAIDFAS